MRTLAVVVVCGLAACAAPRERQRPVPLARAAAPVALAGGPAREPALEPRLRAAADRSPPLPPRDDVPAAFAGDVSLHRFTVTSETRTQPPEPEPAPEPYRAAAPVDSWDVAPGDGYYWYPDRCEREPWVPVNTVVGASIGAAFDAGHCGHGHGYQGALIGAGIGLTLDLGRLFAR